MEKFIFEFKHFINPSEAFNYMRQAKKVIINSEGFNKIPVSVFKNMESYWDLEFKNKYKHLRKSFLQQLNQVEKSREDDIESHRNFIDYMKELIRWRSQKEIIRILQFLYPESKNHFELVVNKKSFCTAPWFGLNIHPAGKIYPCCAYDQKNPLGHLSENQIDDIRQSEKMNYLKDQFKKGQRAIGCESCYQSDDAGGDNLKEHLKSIHLFYLPLLSLAEKTKEKLPLLYLDVQFSNTCNLKCRICGPDFSSGWLKDYETLYNLTDHPFKPKAIKKSFPHQWESMLDTIQEVDEVYFWGGEPLLMTEHYEFLNRLAEEKKENVRLRYSTNFSELTPGHWNVTPLWRKFNRVTVGASLDGMGNRAELMRKGLSWEKVLINRKRLQQEVPHARFFIACATSAYNIWHIPDFFKSWVQQGFIQEKDFCINLLYEPTRLSVQILPLNLKNEITSKIEDLIQNFIVKNFGSGTQSEQRFRAAIHHMNAVDRTDLLPEFMWYNENVDRIRQEDLFHVFPELSEIKNHVSPEQIQAIQL